MTSSTPDGVFIDAKLHPYYSSDGLYCDTCNLPSTNHRHVQWNLSNARKLLERKQEEFEAARDDLMALSLLVTRLQVRLAYPDAQTVGINVSEQYDSGRTFTTSNVEGVYDASGKPLHAEDDDLDSLVENLYSLVDTHWELDPDDSVTHHLDLDKAELV